MAANSGPRLSAIEIQQEYYEAVGDADWELYEKSDRKFLLQKIAIAICGPPAREGNLIAGDDLKLQGYEKREEEITTKVFHKILEQAKYSQDKENIVISIIRVVCVYPREPVPLLKLTPPDYWVDLHVKKDDVNICIFHVFSLRKCIPTSHGAGCCRVFIDHDGRVYQNWDAYLTENNLPQCVMVVPENGQYKGSIGQDMDSIFDMTDIMPTVKCSVVPSPALGVGAKVLSVADTVSTVANIGAMVGIAGGLLMPAIAPVAIGTAVGIGAVTGVYSIVRSSIHLADRKNHEQSIGLDSTEARSSWINIMVSTAGISVSGATKLLSWAAASGTNVTILMNSVRVLQFTNLGTGFIGIANSLRDMIIRYTEYNERPTGLEIFQLTTSALFFGIGAMSNQTAQEIVQDAQARTINDIREGLPSNVKKKMFDKVTAETRRVQGTVQGNADVIKGLQKIENKSDFFAKLARMNKQMNKNKLRVSLSPDGNPLINNQHKVGVGELHGLGKSGRDQLFAKYGAAEVTTKNAPTRIYPSSSSANTNSTITQETTIWSIRPEEIIKITKFLLTLSKADQDLIYEILSEITRDIHDGFLLICAELIRLLIPTEISLLLSLGSDYKIRIVLFIFNYIKSKIHVDDSDVDLSFANILKRYIKNGRVDASTIKNIKERLMDRTRERLSTNDDPRKYDDLFNFRKSRNIGFITLKAGEIITIGSHKILVKGKTIKELEDWLEMFSQEQSDMFLNLCYKVISSLNNSEFDKLTEINFDEDLILMVSRYLFFGTENEIIDVLTGDLLNDDTGLIMDMALAYKDQLLIWRSLQTIRQYEKCKECFGVRYL